MSKFSDLFTIYTTKQREEVFLDILKKANQEQKNLLDKIKK